MTGDVVWPHNGGGGLQWYVRGQHMLWARLSKVKTEDEPTYIRKDDSHTARVATQCVIANERARDRARVTKLRTFKGQ